MRRYKEKGTYVKDINAGVRVDGVFLVASASRSVTQAGAPYWSLTIADATGTLQGKIWAPVSREIEQIPSGAFAAISGQGSQFRARLEVEIRQFRMLQAEEISRLEIGSFMPASSRPGEEMLAELLALCDKELAYQPWRELIHSVFSEPEIRQRFLTFPAAKMMHHAYAGGLLEHTLNVARLCLLFADRYPVLDRQILLVGAILHDIGKIRELSGGFANDYTGEGELLGHIMLGIELLLPLLSESRIEPPLQEHLKHLIISHHGELEYGSPRLPQTAEAFALHYADNLDAKLAFCSAQFGAESQRPAWSQAVRPFNRKLLLPCTTPESSSRDAGDGEMAIEGACPAEEQSELRTEPEKAQTARNVQAGDQGDLVSFQGRQGQ